MGFGRLLALCKREEACEDNRGKVCLATGEKYDLQHTQNLRVRDVCIEIAKYLGIAPVALDFFTLMTTDCEHCLRPNRQLKQTCTKENDHYLNPKRLLHADECSSKVFFFRLAFKAIPGPDIKNVDGGAFQYFVMQCRWDYLNGRISCLTKKDHLTLLVLESIIQGHENDVSGKDVLDNPKKYGVFHMFLDDEFSVREIKNHLKKQISQFKTCQENIVKAKSSFLSVLEGVKDFGIKKIVVNKSYYNATTKQVNQVEWEILICANGLKKRRTYKDEEDFDTGEKGKAGTSKDEIISDYKDIEYLEIKQSESDEIIHISRLQGFLEVISVGKSMIKKETLITLIEGFYRLLVNQYKTLTRYEPGLELPMPDIRRKEFEIHGPIERKKAEALLKAVDCQNGGRAGVHMIRRSRQTFDSYNLSFISCSGEIRHYEVVTSPSGEYGIIGGPTFKILAELLEHYKTTQGGLSTTLKKYCPIPREGVLCALFDEQIVVEPPHIPLTSRPTNPEYHFTQIGNMQLQKLDHTFTSGSYGDKVFKARCIKDDGSGYQEVFCRRIMPSRSPDFKEKVIKCAEKMDGLVHRNLVHFYGVCFFTEQNTYLALEWVAFGTLDDYLNKETDVTMERLIMFAAQISEACMFLHQHNYVHGWLAAHNVLVVNHEHVKLSDVSVPCLREEEMLQASEELNRSPWKARECFQDRPYSKESDVWAFGVVLWEMFSKLKPFQNMTDDMIIQVFQQDRHLGCPVWCPDGVRKIMKSCWINDPSRRPTFVNIVTELRSVSQNLSPEEKQRKLPQTIDENFVIEPLTENKPVSDFRIKEDQPCTTSDQSNDGDTGSGGTLLSNDNEEITSQSMMLHQELIPEKGPRGMPVWSPEEIELKRIQNKHARMPAAEEHEEATYDRIDVQESDFQEMSDELPEASYRKNGGLPIPDDDVSTEADDMLTRSYEARDRINEDYYSICDLDHIGFLACQLGQGSASEEHQGTSEDERSTSEDHSDTEDSETSDQETVEEESYRGNILILDPMSAFQNLDPFASDFETKSALVFANFNQEKSEEGDNQRQVEKHPLVELASYTSVRAASPSSKRHLNSNGYVKSPNSTKIETIHHVKDSVASKRSPLQDGKSPSTSKRASPAFSSGGLLEFSKLDPFASSTEDSGNFDDSCDSFLTDTFDVEEPLLEKWKSSRGTQNIIPNAKTQSNYVHQKSRSSSSPKLFERVKKDDRHAPLDGFSSFLERDPFSEILTNGTSTNSSSLCPGTEETSFLEKTSSSDTPARIPEKDLIDAASLGSSTPVSRQPKEKQLPSYGGIGTSDVTHFKYEKYAKIPSNPGLQRRGYVPVGCRSPAFPRPRVVATPSEREATPSEREATYQTPLITAKDDPAPFPTFSERDPFSEMQTPAGEVNEEKIAVKEATRKVREGEVSDIVPPVRSGYIKVPAGRSLVANKDRVTLGSEKRGYVKAPVQNHHTKPSQSHVVDEDGSANSSSVDLSLQIGNFSERDVFRDILLSSGDVSSDGGHFSNTTSSPPIKVPSSDNKRFGSGVARSADNGINTSPYQLRTTLKSRETVSNGEKPSTTPSHHAKLPQPNGIALGYSRNNDTCASPYHLNSTLKSRDTISNGEKPHGIPSHHAKSTSTEVPSREKNRNNGIYGSPYHLGSPLKLRDTISNGEKPHGIPSHHAKLSPTEVPSRDKNRNNGIYGSPYLLGSTLKSHDTISNGEKPHGIPSHHAKLSPTEVPSRENNINNGTHGSPYHLGSTLKSRDTINNGEKPHGIPSHHAKLSPTEVPSRENNINNGTHGSPYHLGSTLKSRDTINNGEKPHGIPSHHAKLSPTEVPSRENNINNGTHGSPYHLGSTLKSRDTINNGEKPHGIPSHHAKLSPTEVPSRENNINNGTHGSPYHLGSTLKSRDTINNGEKPHGIPSHHAKLSPTEVPSRENNINNGTHGSPYHLGSTLKSRDTINNGEKPHGIPSHHANLSPTEIPSRDKNRNNGTYGSPYHLGSTLKSRDTISNGENPHGIPSHHAKSTSTEVAPSNSRHFGLEMTRLTNNVSRGNAYHLNSTSSYMSSNSTYGTVKETHQSSHDNDGGKCSNTPNSRTTFPYTELASNIDAAVPNNITDARPYNQSSTSNYARFADESNVADKANDVPGVCDDTNNEDVLGTLGYMAASLGDRDPFCELGAVRTVQVGSKSQLESKEIHSSIVSGHASKSHGRNSPVESERVPNDEQPAAIEKNDLRSEVFSGVSFGNRDPFAELCPSKEDSVEDRLGEPSRRNKIPLDKTNRGGEPSLDGEGVDTVVTLSDNRYGEISDFMKEVTNDPLAGTVKMESNETHQMAVDVSSTRPWSNQSDNVPDELSCKVDVSTGGDTSSGSGGGPSQSPDQAKQKATRKVSDIASEYAKVTIVPAGMHSYQTVVAADETPGGCDLGPVGCEGATSEVGIESEAGAIAEERVETIVDPFNIPAAVESIDNLDTTWPESRPEKKSGARETEAFEDSMKSHLIPFTSLSMNDQERCLGKGAFGVVRRAKLTRRAKHKTRPSVDVAVKCLREGASEIYKNSFKLEAVNLMKLDNKFIVKFLGISYDDDEKLLLVTELVPQGSLDTYLRDPKNLRILGNQVLLQFAIQITMGMQYLECKKLVHRDLAARNILVATESHVKISDFGLSRIYDDEYYRSHRENQKLPIRWLAPECLEQKKFTVNSDVWSLGVTLWEMFSYGKRPYEDMTFKNASELIDYLKKGNQLKQPRDCPEEVFANVIECWHLVPGNRITFFLLKTLLEEILKDKYSKKPYFM